MAQFIARKALVLDCDLFEGRAFQYGPACAVAKRAHNRFLVYYPLGSGKTLAALHAARTFLETEPEGHIIVITTKSNLKTTWPTNQELYLQHVSDVNDRIRYANVYNVDWWFSQDNDFVGHYNRLIQKLSKTYTRQHLIEQTPKHLEMYADRKDFQKFRKALLPTQRKQSMLQATIPPFPFMLIVDECQEYLNLSAQSLLVNALADAAQVTLLLTATPLNDVCQYRGLLRMMGTQKPSKAVLWSDETAEKPIVEDRGIIGVRLTDAEWRQHKLFKVPAKGFTDAYYGKTRQVCNSLSKWSAMANQIELDIQEAPPPKRIVVYSFFRDKGADGFFEFLTKRYAGKIKRGRSNFNVDDIKVRVSLMEDGALDWFNNNTSSCKILLLTSKAGKGISLKNVYSFHLMEPQWSIADEEQAIGRCTRKGSHDRIEPKVRVTRWMAISPEARTRSADQRVRASMLEKKRKTDRLNQRLAKIGKKHLATLLEDFHRT